MTMLSTGVLLKLLDGMNTGAANPVGEHRTSVLQVVEIVPADMDEKDLFPRHRQFHVKVSDLSHSIYAALPPDQADLVLSNKLQLGQLVHVERLDPGSPVPVIVGARPLPGLHPLVVGMPEPAKKAARRRASWVPENHAAGVLASPEPAKKAARRRGSWVPENHAAGVLASPEPGKKAARRRGSWVPENHAAGVLASPKVVRPTALDFGDRTPVKERPSPSVRGSASMRKSTSVMPRRPHPSKIPRSPFTASSMSCMASRTMSKRVREEEPTSLVSTSAKRLSSATRVPLPAKLNALGKDAMEQMEQAQKVAQEALRNASAITNVVRMYKVFSDVSKTARADVPAACFDGFLSFHQEVVQAVAYMESITAAATSDEPAAVAEEAPPPNVLQEIAQNRTTTPRRRGLLGFDGGVSKSAGTLLDPSSRQDGGRSSSASRKCLAVGDDRKSPPPAAAAVTPSVLGSSLRMAKQMQAEAGSWFMEFLEAALETGLKKSAGGGGGCPHSLMLRVINWVEMEQTGGSRKASHPRAAAVARKLRIKAHEPLIHLRSGDSSRV